ncbi:MAG: superoxide dismutase [Rickettsiales bacterium]
MPFALPDLPYPKNALEPHISAETLEYHHGKHHAAYVNKLNELLKDSPLANAPLEEVISTSDGPIFNNAAQIWNHTFYWHCMAPNASSAPSCPKLAAQIAKDFGSLDNFKKQFADAAATQFGSGWAWLVYSNEKCRLEIIKTGNADTPIKSNACVPLLTIDVWEHAYYVDYRNKRPDYIATFNDKLINWEFVAKNFNAATEKAKAA